MESDSMSRLSECPRDVLERVMDLVISVFPVADLCRLRTVCKEWNKIITTRALQENGQLRFNKLELLAVCDVDCSREFKAYDVEAERWHSFDLSFLPDPGDGGFRVLDFAGGFACVLQTTAMEMRYTFEFSSLPVANLIPIAQPLPPRPEPLSKRDIERALYVCNPLTKRWVQLPPPSTSSAYLNPYSYHLVIVRIYHCRKMGYYKVFVVSAAGVNPHKLVWWPINQLVVKEFDSFSCEWVVHLHTCHEFCWNEVMGVGVLPCNNGNAASLIIFLDSRKPHERGVFALLFDEGKGGSAFVKIGAALPSNLLNPTMVCCEQNPRPLLVSMVGDGNAVTGIEIWELNNQLTEWTYLAAMPSDLFTRFESLYREPLVTWLNTDGRMRAGRPRQPIPRRMVAVPYKHLIYVHDDSEMSWTIAYNMLTRTWHWMSAKLPSEINTIVFPKGNEESRLSGVRGCAFEESLASVLPMNGSN